MALDYDTLTDVQPTWFTFGFHGAEPYVTNATEYFADVRRVVDAGHAWTGEGQPQAALVMRTNALALETARLQMQAGIAATDALTSAISTAKEEAAQVYSELAALVEGAGYYISTTADGGLIVQPIPGGGDGHDAAFEDDIRLANLKMASIMNYARSADLTASQLLARIAETRPVFTANASTATLTYNAAVHGIATKNLVLATLTEELWQVVHPQEWLPVEDPGFSWTNALKSLFGLEDLETLIESRAKDQALDTLSKSLGVFGKNAGKAVPVFGNYFGVLDALRAGSQDPYLAGSTEPRTPFGTPEAAGDEALQDAIDEYYLGDNPLSRLTLAQAARLQAVGALEDSGHDYVTRARELRDRLRYWVPGPDAEVVEGPERHNQRLAERLVRQLDAAPGER